MGQKANPIGLRVGINRTWDSLWFTKKNYSNLLKDDLQIREYVLSFFKTAGVSRVVIERSDKKPHITVFASRPGAIIGKKGSGIETFLANIKKKFSIECTFNIVELRKPGLYAQVVANDIAMQISDRVFYKRAMKKALQNCMKSGAQGVKIECAGRLGGAEIARSEWYMEGRVPLHTMRADIDYANSVADTTYGTCGVKVWIYRGYVLGRSSTLMERRLGEVSVK